MTTISKPELTAALVKFFLTSGENPAPGELAEEVLFTFPYADPVAQLSNPVNSIASAVAGVTVVTHPPVPDDEYWLYHAVAAIHNDSTARDIRFILNDVARVFELPIHTELAVGQSVWASIRNVVVPPGWRIIVRCPVGGAFILTSNAMHTEHGLVQPVMNVSS